MDVEKPIGTEIDMFKIFPTEIIEKILIHLSVRDLYACSIVSKSWRTGVNIDLIWREHCLASHYSPTLLKEFETHPSIESFELAKPTDIESECSWKKVYSLHRRLRDNWSSRHYTKYRLSVNESQVFCLDCDGTQAAAGHLDSTITLWQIKGIPHHLQTINAVLNSVPVIGVKIGTNVVIALQKRLLQIFRQRNDQKYILADAKSFELGDENIELYQQIQTLGEKFEHWYKECLRINETYSSKRIVYSIFKNLLFASCGTTDMLNVWMTDGTVRASLGGLRNIKEILTDSDHVYIISNENPTVVSRYSLNENQLERIFTVPGKKKIIFGEEFIMAIPRPCDTKLKMLWIWDKTFTHISNKIVALGHLNAVLAYYVIYSENADVSVWDPRTDTILKKFSTGSSIGFMRLAFSSFFVVFMNDSLNIWDFKTGKRVYRLYSGLEWCGDFRDLLWVNPSMIISGGVKNQLELLSFW